MLNKKLLQRLTVAGLIAVTTIGFAGCGDEKKSIMCGLSQTNDFLRTLM